MNFQQLNYCKQLAKMKSFVAAAEACNVTQSTLSNGVAALEQELGVQIFTRTTRSVMLSSAGESILPSLLDVLGAKAALVAKAIEIAKPANQIIRIGVSPLIEAALAELVTFSFKQVHSGVNFILREMNLDEMIGALKTEQLDFVLGPSSDDSRSDTDLQSMVVHTEPLVFIPARKSNSQDHYGQQVAIKDIASEQFVMVPDTCGLSRCTHAVFKHNGLKLKAYPGHALSYGILQDWARIGVGSAIIPLSKLNKNSDKILIIGKDKQILKIEYCVIWKSKHSASSTLDQFGKHLLKTAPEIFAGAA